MDSQYFLELFKAVFGMGRNLLVAIPTLLSIVPLLLSFFLPKWEGGKMKQVIRKAREHPAVICMSFLMLSVILASHSLYVNKEPNFATPDELTQSVLENRDIRIADLVRETARIRNKTFIDCHIYGPAVVHPLAEPGATIIGNTIVVGPDPESGFIVTTNTNAIGVIGLENCKLIRCTFHYISFIGRPEQITIIKKGFSAK